MSCSLRKLNRPTASPLRTAFGAACLLGLLNGILAADETTLVRTGVTFREQLRRPINIFQRGVTVRDMAEGLSSRHRIAVLLDRRIDPDRVVDVQLAQMTLQEGLEQFAIQLGADAAVIGSTVMMGPPEPLDRLRTDAVRQTEFLRSLAEEDLRERTFALIVGQTFRWDDLQRPRDLLQTVAARFHVTVANLELIPHDLWAEGVLANVSAPQALAMIAGQFDLTFSWSGDVSGIVLEPAPERLTIEQTHAAPSDGMETAVAAAAEVCPLAEFRRVGRSLHVRATVGEHERIASILSPPPDPPVGAVSELGPLTQRRFTLAVQRAPAIAVLRTLEAQGVVLEYDADALKSAGVDLSRKISLSLEEAPAAEFFRALCEPLGLDFEINGSAVRLRPR